MHYTLSELLNLKFLKKKNTFYLKHIYFVSNVLLILLIFHVFVFKTNCFTQNNSALTIIAALVYTKCKHYVADV